MVNKNRILIGAGILLVVVAGTLFYASEKGLIFTAGQKRNFMVSREGLILYLETGFSPNFLTIKKGTKVTFMNLSDDGSLVWVGSDLHPTHANYPGSSIDKCGLEAALQIFDSCSGVLPGAYWSYTFNEIGVWGYHNHLFSRHTGVIKVE